MKRNRNLTILALLMGWLAGQNVGIGTNTPTQRLHVAGNLRLDNAFMPGNQAGAVGNILLSQGPGVAPAWLPNGAIGTILMIGPGGTPVWAPNPICTSPTQNRFIKFTSTSPTAVCNTTLAENNAGNIWNADGAGAPVAGADKFEIIATAAMPNAINGYTTAASGIGVYGQATGANGRGVYGITNQATGIGVLGVNTNANGTAGFFRNTAAAGGGSGDALYAQTDQAGGFGVWGVNLNTQANTNPVGVVGSGGTGTGIYVTGGGGGSFTGRRIGVAGFKIGSLTNGQGGGYFTGDLAGNPPTATHYAYVAWRSDGSIGTAGTNYKIIGTGNVSTIVDGVSGKSDRRVMFCPEMPEIIFMDVGQGQLQNGRAYISLDPILAKNIVVNERHPLRVFIQLEDECNGVRVTNKSQNGFEVVELNGGTSNARFTYFVIANRADEYDANGNLFSKHEDIRFPIAPGPLPVVAREAKPIEGKVQIKPVPTQSK